MNDIRYELTPEVLKLFAKERKWDNGGLIGVPFLVHYPMYASGPMFVKNDPAFGFDFYASWYENGGTSCIVVWDKNVMLSRAHQLLERADFFREKYGEWTATLAPYEAFVASMDPDSISSETYDGFEKVYLEQYSRAFYPEYFLYSDEMLSDLIRKYGQDSVHAAIEPRMQTFINRYKTALVGAALHDDADAAARAVLASFHWIRNNYRATDTLTLDAVMSEIEELRSRHPREELESMLEEMEAAREAVPELYGRCTAAERTLLEMFALSAEWLDRRKESNLKAGSVINAYLRQQAEALGIPFADLQFLFPEEFRQIRDEGQSIDSFPIAARKEFCLELSIASIGKFLLTRENAGPLMKYHPSELDSLGSATEVRGQTAQKGKVRGPVVVVEDPSTVTDFAPGSILVTYMTRPEFVPLMKKSAGIVTNEGGITSHAAIISRELKIPCVIGTKVATRTFKTGDMVEVDADAGIVRKI